MADPMRLHKLRIGEGRERARRALFVLSVAAIAAATGGTCTHEPMPPLSHDAYVWQRVWTDEVGRAVAASRSRVRAWRVLAGEVHARGRLARISVPPAPLTQNGDSVFLVIRMNGQVTGWETSALTRDILNLLDEWRKAGASVVGLEIDHDCATHLLARYASLLADIRHVLPEGIALSITALPTWIGDRHLLDVLARIDEAVLQVHAVSSPESGLFDAERALAWTRAWGELSDVSFRVALPTYGSRVVWNDSGRVVGVESEVPLGADGPRSREIFADPVEIAAFLERLWVERPRKLAGIAWFRLPAEGDRRAWSLSTWHSVMDGSTLETRFAVRAVPANLPGVFDVLLKNEGPVDARLPAELRVVAARGCAASDALANYLAHAHGGGVDFKLVEPALLKAFQQRVVGWVRCSSGGVQVHADL